jgi:cysteinyl-tRNA synthetase
MRSKAMNKQEKIVSNIFYDLMFIDCITDIEDKINTAIDYEEEATARILFNLLQIKKLNNARIKELKS